MTARLEVESAGGVDGGLFWNEQAAGRARREEVGQRLGHREGGLSQPEHVDPSDVPQKIFALVDKKRFPLAANEARGCRAWLNGLQRHGENARHRRAMRVAGQSVCGK
jgi:hypothetical protein